MKVLFVYSLDDVQSAQTPMRSWSSIQFGISYISSLLKTKGHQTKLVVLGSTQWKDSISMVRASIEEFQPRLICFTAVYSQYAFIEKIAGFIKSNWPDKYLIVGGAHATLRPDEVIAGSFDALCVGEGEYPVLELCRQLEGNDAPRGIANLWLKSSEGSVEKNRTRDFLQELDELPFPDRDMWRPWLKEKVDDELSVLLGRGCPYDCTYCSNHVLRGVAAGKYVRTRSPENILREIASLYDNYPIRRMYFEIESIAINKGWMIELCDILADFNSKADQSISFGSNFRVTNQSIDENLFAAFEKASFYKINIGLESGSQRIRSAILKRNYSNDDFMSAVSLARKHGIKVYVFNMIGLPGESLDDHLETVMLNRRCQPDGHYTGIFYPYPGTELYDMCVQQGLIQGEPDSRKERMEPVIGLPEFSKAQIRRAYTWFDYNVYRGYRPLWKILLQVAVVKIRSNLTANSLFRLIAKLPVLRHLRAKLAKN